MNIEVNEEKRCIFCQSSTTRVSRGSARALTGSWQQRHASLHSQTPLCTSAVTLTPGHAARHLISGLFRRAVRSAAMCRSRGPPPASSSPLGAYSSPAAHRITPHNLTSPLYLPLSTYILVDHAPPPYAQRLGRVRGHHVTREQHASLSPAPQVTHAVAPVTGEYVPAQHQHA